MNTPINQNQPSQNQQVSKFPKNDIMDNYQSDTEESPEKFDYLKAKYIFRFPHTITSIKWGLTLGSVFGLHTFIKTRNVKNSVYWFVWGSVLTGLPIWGVFMFKYSFYTMTLRKFEVEQYQQIEDSNVIKDFLVSKAGLKNIHKMNDDTLVKKIEQKQKKHLIKNSQLDSLLDEIDENEFELIPQQQQQQQDQNTQ